MYDVCSLSLSFYLYTYYTLIYNIAIENYYILLFSCRDIHCEKGPLFKPPGVFATDSEEYGWSIFGIRFDGSEFQPSPS